VLWLTLPTFEGAHPEPAHERERDVVRWVKAMQDKFRMLDTGAFQILGEELGTA
jgi:hypothetical protein